VLKDTGHLDFDEPFGALFTQGMIIKNGAKMSKSKGNVVSPDELVDRYGADTIRLYTLFIGPPEKDAEWNDQGVPGAWRFLNRVWRVVTAYAEGNLVITDAKGEKAIHSKTHEAIQKITRDMEGSFHFNTAISQVMELVNELYRHTKNEKSSQKDGVLHDAVHDLVQLIAPFAPHIAEELWTRLGRDASVFKSGWPQFDPKAIEVQKDTIVVQVNGRVRHRVEVPLEITEDALKEQVLNEKALEAWIKDKTIRKVIVVPRRLVNVVV